MKEYGAIWHHNELDLAICTHFFNSRPEEAYQNLNTNGICDAILHRTSFKPSLVIKLFPVLRPHAISRGGHIHV